MLMQHEPPQLEERPAVATTAPRPPTAKRRRLRYPPLALLIRINRYLVGLAAVTAFVIAWNELSLHHVHWILDFSNVPSAQSVARHFWLALHSHSFYVNVLISLRRVWISFIIAAVLGIVIGLTMARLTVMRMIFYPFVELFRPIPAIAWIPLAILMFPTTESSILFITFLGALFPIILNTFRGACQTPEQLMRAARSLGASRRSVLWHVVIPSAMPNIVTGLVVGMGISWFSLLTGEMIGGQNGIGNYTWEAYQLIRYPDIIVGMIAIGLLSTLSTYALQLACSPLIRWSKAS